LVFAFSIKKLVQVVREAARPHEKDAWAFEGLVGPHLVSGALVEIMPKFRYIELGV